MTDNLGKRQREFIELLPASPSEIADAMGITESSVTTKKRTLVEKGVGVRYNPDSGTYRLDGDSPDDGDTDLPDLSDVDRGDDPDESDLTDREAYVARELQTGATIDGLADDLGERESVVTQHVRDLKRQGWKVYIDESASHVAIEGDHTLRSSEHTGTRTRKANRWWEQTHNQLVRNEKGLSLPSVDDDAEPDREDWVTHMTDLHAGDIVRGYDDEQVIHDTDELPGLIDYITRQSTRLADKHGSPYDTAYLLWGGDMVTNEGIYEGQFEDLDAWLDEQVDTMIPPLLRQIKTFSKEFDTVRVICQAGNHGDVRASGSSKQANADLILYKAIRNTIGELQREGLYENVGFKIGRAGSPTVFHLRDGAIHGQLRHGQDRSPQFDTSARQKEWLSTIMDSLNLGSMVDMVWMGHHHVSGRLPWNGPPVMITGSPKPGGEYPRKLGVLTGPQKQKVATVHGVSDDGITGVFPVDTRDYSG